MSARVPQEQIVSQLDALSEANRTAHTNAVSAVDSYIAHIQACRETLTGGGDVNVTSTVTGLAKTLGGSAEASAAATEQKAVYNQYIATATSVEATYTSAFTPGVTDMELDSEPINAAVAEHLFRSGRADIGTTFVNESGTPLPTDNLAPFETMNSILEAIERHDLSSAMTWVNENKEGLTAAHSTLPFKLHRLAFMCMLSEGRLDDSLEYARANLSAHASSQLPAVQRLMGALLYCGRLDESPYADLLSPVHWSDVARTFTRDACSLLGVSQDSVLSICVTAGVTALPYLKKMMSVTRTKFTEMKALPVEVELDRRYYFHSTFCCPVAKEPTTEDNPPMMLVCGHVISQGSLSKLGRSSTSRIKCPYCPVEQSQAQAKRLYW